MLDVRFAVGNGSGRRRRNQGRGVTVDSRCGRLAGIVHERDVFLRSRFDPCNVRCLGIKRAARVAIAELIAENAVESGCVA